MTSLRVLTYHRVAEQDEYPWLHPSLISATPAEFARQMRYLVTHHRPISVDDVICAADGGKALPGNAVLITFDDGYRDFVENAWPILRQHRIPVCLFVPTAYPQKPDTPFWWDRLYEAVRFATTDSCDHRFRLRLLQTVQDHVKTLQHEAAMNFVDDFCSRLMPRIEHRRSVLDWETLRALSGAGVRIGSHTRSHPILTRVPISTARTEIRQSMAEIKTEIGPELPIFCYPGGSCNEAIKGLLREENVRLAFATSEGLNDLKMCDPLVLRRTNITTRTTFPIFQLRMQRWFAPLDSWRKGA